MTCNCSLMAPRDHVPKEICLAIDDGLQERNALFTVRLNQRQKHQPWLRQEMRKMGGKVHEYVATSCYMTEIFWLIRCSVADGFRDLADVPEAQRPFWALVAKFRMREQRFQLRVRGRRRLRARSLPPKHNGSSVFGPPVSTTSLQWSPDTEGLCA